MKKEKESKKIDEKKPTNKEKNRRKNCIYLNNRGKKGKNQRKKSRNEVAKIREKTAEKGEKSQEKGLKNLRKN